MHYKQIKTARWKRHGTLHCIMVIVHIFFFFSFALHTGEKLCLYNFCTVELHKYLIKAVILTSYRGKLQTFHNKKKLSQNLDHYTFHILSLSGDVSSTVIITWLFDLVLRPLYIFFLQKTDTIHRLCSENSDIDTSDWALNKVWQKVFFFFLLFLLIYKLCMS